MKRDYIFFGISALLAVLILVVLGRSTWPKKIVNGNANSSTTQNLTLLNAPTVVYGNPIRGANLPKVTIVEFGNYLCGPCVEMEQTLKQLLKDFPTQLRVVWKDLLDFTKPNELATAQAARCSQNQGKFWEYHDLLFANPTQSYSSDNLNIYANLLKLDSKVFTACLDAQTTRPIIERDVEEALRLRVDGTPYLFVNGDRISGALGYNELKQLIVNKLNSTDKK